MTPKIYANFTKPAIVHLDGLPTPLLTLQEAVIHFNNYLSPEQRKDATISCDGVIYNADQIKEGVYRI